MLAHVILSRRRRISTYIYCRRYIGNVAQGFSPDKKTLQSRFISEFRCEMKKWLPVAIWMSIIFYASVVRVGTSVSAFWPNVVHFVEYGILGVAFLRAIGLTWNTDFTKAVVYSIAAVTVYGAAMEVVQSFLPYRSFSVEDMLVNFTGALVFILALKLLKLQIRWFKEEN